MDVRKKRELPCIQNRSEARFLGSESKNQNSENIFQVFLHSPCTCKNFSIKTFPRQSKLIIYITLHYITLHYIRLHYITLHYITHTEILLS